MVVVPQESKNWLQLDGEQSITSSGLAPETCCLQKREVGKDQATKTLPLFREFSCEVAWAKSFSPLMALDLAFKWMSRWHPISMILFLSLRQARYQPTSNRLRMLRNLQA